MPTGLPLLEGQSILTDKQRYATPHELLQIVWAGTDAQGRSSAADRAHQSYHTSYTPVV